MTKRIENAIDIFLDAINDGTLAKGNCCACAVGNLVAKGMGVKVLPKSETYPFFKVDNPKFDNSEWSSLFSTTGDGIQLRQNFSDKRFKGVIERTVSKTEFSVEELADIEYIFETNTKMHHINYDAYSKEEIRADQIKGLEAVVKLMLKFDEQPDDVKEVFTNKVALVTA